MLNWNPDTSQITLPPTNNLTTPAPEIFPPDAPRDGICADTAQPGDLIEVVVPNTTQIILRYVGAIEVVTSADVRSLEHDQWGKVTFRNNFSVPPTLDTPTVETKIYAPPALTVPMPYGVTPGMVTGDMMTGGESSVWVNGQALLEGCPCVTASRSEFQGIERKICYHEENIDDTETAWNALPPEVGVGLLTAKSRRILTTYMITITFPFAQATPPPLAPIMASLGVLSLCLMGAAGAGHAAANTLKRRHQWGK